MRCWSTPVTSSGTTQVGGFPEDGGAVFLVEVLEDALGQIQKWLAEPVCVEQPTGFEKKNTVKSTRVSGMHGGGSTTRP